MTLNHKRQPDQSCDGRIADGHDPTICDRALFSYRVRLVIPSGVLKLWEPQIFCRYLLLLALLDRIPKGAGVSLVQWNEQHRLLLSRPTRSFCFFGRAQAGIGRLDHFVECGGGIVVQVGVVP